MKRYVTVRIIVAIITVVLTNAAINVAAWVSRDRLPVGTVTNKIVAPVYYEGLPSEAAAHWLVVTSPNGRRHTAVVLAEETWQLYEIGDEVTMWGVNK